MALWGDKDDKTSTGTIAIDAAGAVTGTTTAFTTEARVGDYIVDDATGEHYLITVITDNTTATVVAGVPGATLTAVSAGQAYSLTEKPNYVTNAETPDGTHGDPENVYGVDDTEAEAMRAAGPRAAHTGWVRRIEGTGGRAGRVTFETMVAMSALNGDANDDAVIPDATIIISSQPVDSSATTGSAVTFSVTASTVPVGVPITYRWQRSADAVNWTDIDGVIDGAVYSDFATDTLAVSDNTGLNNVYYQCILQVTGTVVVATDTVQIFEV